MLRALGAETNSQFQETCIRGNELGAQLEWDKTGGLLWLVGTQVEQEDPNGDELQGMLSVFNVSQGILLAPSKYTSMSTPWVCFKYAAVWLGSQGLVLSSWIRLQAPDAFTGFALTFLPYPCYLVSSYLKPSSLPDGQKLVARMLEVDSDDGEDNGFDNDDHVYDHCFLHCQLEGLHCKLSQADWVFKGHGWSWLPCSSGVVLGMFFKHSNAQVSQIVYFGDQQQTPVVVPGPTPRLPMFFSPSQTMVAVNAEHGPRIHSLRSGSQLWDPGDAVPSWGLEPTAMEEY